MLAMGKWGFFFAVSEILSSFLLDSMQCFWTNIAKKTVLSEYQLCEYQGKIVDFLYPHNRYQVMKGLKATEYSWNK